MAVRAEPAVYRACALALLAAGCLSRVVWLDMDPHYYQWGGFVTDEGRWSEHARALALHGSLTEGKNLLHLVLAPLYQLASYASFEAFGVSLASARAISAVAGCALLIGIGLLLRRFTSPPTVLVALSGVALHADYVMLSRIAIPEMPAMALSFAAFALLVSDWPRRRRLLAAGALIGAAAGVKATCLPSVGIFAAIACLDRRAGPGAGARIRDAGWLLLPVAAAGVAVLAIVPTDWWAPAAGVGGVVGGFLGTRTLFDAFDLVQSSTIAPVLCTAGLGVWLGITGLIAGRPAAADPRRRLAEAAGIWAGLYLSVTIAQAYFPERYVVHALTPALLLAATGIDVLLERGLAGLAPFVARDGLARGLPGVAWLAFPTGVLAAPVLAGVLVALGIEARLLTWLFSIALTWLAAGLALANRRDRPRALRMGVGVPIVAATLWFAGWAISTTHFRFWPDAGSPLASARMAAILIVAFALAARVRASGRVLAAVAAASAATIWTLHLAPAYLDRHYTLRDASRDLGARFGSQPLTQLSAEGLFLENSTPYVRLQSGWEQHPPEVLVTAFRFVGDRDFLRDHYEPIAHYDLYFSPKFRAAPAVRWEHNCCSPHGHTASVYRLRDPTAD